MIPIAETMVPGARVEFWPDMPAAVRSDVLRFWPGLEWLVPRWVRSVRFAWQASAEDGESASCNVSFAYGWMTITLTGLWLDDSDEQKRRDLTHEMLHAWFEPIAGYAKETAETLLKDSPLFLETVKREITHRMEFAIQGLAYAVMERNRCASTDSCTCAQSG